MNLCFFSYILASRRVLPLIYLLIRTWISLCNYERSNFCYSIQWFLTVFFSMVSIKFIHSLFFENYFSGITHYSFEVNTTQIGVLFHIFVLFFTTSHYLPFIVTLQTNRLPKKIPYKYVGISTYFSLINTDSNYLRTIQQLWIL